MTPSAGRRKAAEATAEQLRRRILKGAIEPGTDLPAERELAGQLGVSRLTLRAALARLEAEGLVRPVQGSGTRVLDFRDSAGLELVAHLASQALERGDLPVDLVRDLLELRRMLAVEILGLVAERASSEQLRGLRDHVRHQRECVGHAHAFVQADLQFARRVVAAADNLPMQLLANTVQRMVDQQPGLQLAFTSNRSQAVDVYDKLVDLLESRDPVRVRKVAQRLLDRLDRITLERIEALGPDVQPAVLQEQGGC
jgi:DNA-binding FadR family transcriptional regulator